VPIAALLSFALSASGVQGPPLQFERRVLSTEFFSEGAVAADFNRDGHVDVASGPWMYLGPDLEARTELYAPVPFDPAGYSDNFFAWAHDVDADGWLDVVMVGFPGENAEWFGNPGPNDGPWSRNLILAGVDDESPLFVDLTGDGRPELVFAHQGRMGWASPGANPQQPWTWHAATADMKFQRFTHGLGVGDIDGDGRADILERTGWWRQPPTLGPEWKRHAFDFGDRRGGAQMYAYDVDGDGDNDVITSLDAHGFGLSWFEQQSVAGNISFVEHRIMDAEPGTFHFAELHALDLVDLDGDGLKDIVTGKRWWSHGAQGDPMPGSPAVVVWFQLSRGPGGATFTPHLCDDDSGVGTQVSTADVDLDGALDIVIGNKRGSFVLYQRPGEAPPAPPAPKQERDSKNLDFEAGDLSSWTAEGPAFQSQPVRGDTVRARGREPSGHAGDYWIGGYEKVGDAARGTLTSEWFTVTQPWASFLVGGGAGHGERVEVALEGESAPFFVSSGANHETLQRVVVPLAAQQGKRIRVRLVDDEVGGWGHINFDDWRFHAQEPVFERPAGTPPILASDPPKQEGLSASVAAKTMRVPPGFSVDVIVAEPDLHQPIALAIDARGRLWVAEAFTYPQRAPEGLGRDDIVVFEDEDLDGSFEKRTVFLSGINLISGLEVGYGGVWIGAAPYFQFVPDANDDLVPDGPAQTLLDGWGYQDTHETLNGFIWGPEGWLYGCHGVFTHSRVGAPGTPDEQRVPINAGIWRFHPLRKQFEVFAWGTSNPWGVDFDSRGQAFATACVIPHLFHVVQGGRFERQAGEHFGAHVYDDIKTIADHRHYLGDTPHGGNLRSDSAGGGHAHCGALIYQGDKFPAAYRDTIFFDNIHGNRINNDRMLASGSGFVGAHADDFLLADDAWFRGINFKTGPDGAVYFIDWYDRQACHWTEPSIWDRTNGRLYRVRYGEVAPRAMNLPARSSLELVELQQDKNDFVARRARTEFASRPRDEKALALLAANLRKGTPDEALALRWLWTLHSGGGLDEALALALLDSPQVYVQAWTIQLACERGQPGPALLAKLKSLANSTPSPVVRLYLASALQRFPAGARLDLAAPLLSRAEDAADHNLPLMLWYAIEPALPLEPARAMQLARGAKLPNIPRFVLRRLAAEPEQHEFLLSQLLLEPEPKLRLVLLEELERSLRARRDLAAPRAWGAAATWASKSPDARVVELAQSIAVAYGDAQSLALVRALLADKSRDAKSRSNAVDVVARARDPQSLELLLGLLDESALRRKSLAALAVYDDPRIGPSIARRLGTLDAEDRRIAVATLSSRASTARTLFEAIAAGSIDKSCIDAIVARKLADLGDKQVDAGLALHFGRVNATSAQKQARIAELKARLGPEVLAKADLANGRELFSRTCQQCHTLFGVGANVGPDITGSNRADLDYLLTNIVDPSAVVTKEYQVTLVWLTDERLLSGILKQQDEQSLTLQDQQGTSVVVRSDIDEIKPAGPSMMPEGQIDVMSADEVRDLIAYIASPRQTPIRATKDNVGKFFDGKTLSGWKGDPAVFSVEDGTIFGRTKGLERNAFLHSELELGDFRLVFEVRLDKDLGNSGMQLRSVPLENGEMRGYQADIGLGWWGALYEEEGRGLLSPAPAADGRVFADGWNTYEIVAVGSRVMTAINGKPCVDIDDPAGARRGVLALQVHSGGPTTVRVRKLKLELDPRPELITAGGAR